uniref:Integrase, catalytic region, zinc finger, CCHC-type, peptidase aspartic, catalytic n=1 Tax=Tanacetum cinerariifolium TaxID=118510 RepID=A0A6L2J4I8_TANCI|nr:integrase, catalytic region, zinc finger, CCHC-type, peptidase aspartic, catalytic [Tanacetum cinerariifolium]
MDPNLSLGKICLGENVIEISSDKVEGSRDWDSPEHQDTANNGGKKETKAMVFHKMDTEEISDRFMVPCFLNGLEAYDGEINLGVEENMILKEYVVKLCLEHEVKRGNKVVKKELIIALRDDIPLLGGEELLSFVCKMGKSNRNKKRAMKNLILFYQDIGTSSSTGRHLTQKEAAKEALALRINQKFALLKEVRPVLETMAYHDKYKKVLDEIWKDNVELDGMIMKEEEEAIKKVKDMNTMPYRIYESLKELMKMEYLYDDEDVFVYYSLEKVLSIEEDVYLQWCLEFFSTMYFERGVDRTNLMTEKCFWFRLCRRELVLTLPRFAVLLRLYDPSKLDHRLFAKHFSKLEIDDKLFDHDAYWRKIGQTCPSINNSSDKLVAVSLKNKDKRVRFTEAVTSSGNTNIKTASSSNLVSNKPMLPSTGVKLSTSASRSQPSGNTKKDKIQRPLSSTQKNNKETHPRTIKSSLINKNCDVEPKGTAITWKPIGQTFTIVGNECPLTRITTTTDVPFRKPIALETNTPKPVVTLVYSKKPMKSKTTDHVSKSKVIKSVSANKKEPSKSWGSTASNVPSSSLDECRFSKLFSGYGDYQIGNVTISRVYYVEGLGHNLFFVGQFCDWKLEDAFHQHTCYIRNLEGVDLLTGSQRNNLYTLSLRDMMARIIETIHVDFDELTAMASEHSSSRPALHEMTPSTISSELVPNPPPSTPFVSPSRTDWDLMFQPLFDKLLTLPPSVDHPAPKVIDLIADVVALEPAASTGLPSSTTVDQDAPSPSNSQTLPKTQTHVISNNVEEDNHDLDVAHMNNDPFFGVEESPKTPNFCDDPLHEDLTSQGSSSNMRQTHTLFESVGRWSKDHPIDTGMSITAYADADHVGCQDTRCSTSGSAQFIGDKLVSWSSKKQKIMDTMKAQQITLDDTLVAPANRLKIGKCDHRLNSNLKSNEPSIQVVLDALKLTPFYNAFLITANVLEIYMQEFWATVSIHHHSLHFNLYGRSHTLNVENFKDMLHIFPRLPGQRFQDPPLEEEILSFIRDLGHTGEIKVLTDVNVNYMHQPCTRLKSKAKVTKPDMKKQPAKKIKAKGLAVLSEVALSEAEQIKMATKKSKKDFHISHASGSCDGVDAQSKVPDEQVQKTSGTNEGTGTIPRVPDVPPYESESDKESWGDSEDEDDKDDDGVDDNDDGDNDDDAESNDHDDDKEDVDESVRTPFENELTDDEKLDDEETIDDEEDYEQQTPTIPTSTYINPTVTLPKIPNFAFVFKFDQRVSALETEMFELKQTNQFVKALSSIPVIIDQYLASKMKEAVNVDSTMKKIIKNQVKEQVSKINIEKYVTESLRSEVLVRSTNQPQTAYGVATSLSEFKLKNILIDKMEADKSIDISDNQKNLYNALVESYNSDKDILTSYGDVVLLKSRRDDQDKDEDPFVGSDRGTKRRKSGKDAESSKDSRSKEKKSSSTSKEASQSQHKTSDNSAHTEEPSHTVEELGMQQDQEFITRDNDE